MLPHFENAALLTWLVFLSLNDLEQGAELSVFFYERGASLVQVVAQLHRLELLAVEQLMARQLLRPLVRSFLQEGGGELIGWLVTK